MSDILEIQKLQTDLVVAVAQCFDDKWERIVVHYEVLDSADSHVEGQMAFYVHKDGAGKHSIESFDLSDDAVALFQALWKRPEPGKGDHWGTCVLKVDPPGKFNFEFSYDPPKRLNGIFDDEFKYYSRYLPHYLKEKGLDA